MKVAELFYLLGLNVWVSLKNALEYLRVIWRYYGNRKFRRADAAMRWAYLFSNPFRIHRRFEEAQGATDPYTYGETPLTTLELICRRADIKAQDVVYEMGCGRGTCVFWMHCLLACRAIGVDIVPTFIERASIIAKHCKLSGVEFRLEDMLETDIHDATVIYFYGTSSPRPFVEAFMQKVAELPKGTKVITVSYPLTQISASAPFELVDSFSAPYTWGNAMVYIHHRT